MEYYKWNYSDSVIFVPCNIRIVLATLQYDKVNRLSGNIHVSRLKSKQNSYYILFVNKNKRCDKTVMPLVPYRKMLGEII